MFATVQSAMAADTHAGMWALLKIAAVFAVMVFLIRRRMAIGYVLLIASILLGVVMGVGFSEASGSGLKWLLAGVWNLAVEVVRAATLPRSLRLLCLVLTITVFGVVMKRVEKLRDLADSLLALLRDRRWAMAWLSSLIGLLPMPGGAMVSAPMVGEVAEGLDISREDKTAINHWMRHIWEYVDPLYPGLLTAASTLSVPITALMLAQSPLCVAAIIAGIVFLLRHVPHHQRRVGDEAGKRRVMPVVRAIAPVVVVVVAAAIPQALATIIRSYPRFAESLPGGAIWNDRGFLSARLTVATELCMLAALFGVICAMLRSNRIRRGEGWQILRQGVTLKMTALVVGVCVMKGMLVTSGSSRAITVYLQSSGLPVPVIIGSILFVVGMLLGYTLGFVSICYPLLESMLRLPDGGLNYPLAAFAFGVGFLGVLLSPVHLCLVLSREHFDASWGGSYKRLLPPSVFVFAVACLMLIWA